MEVTHSAQASGAWLARVSKGLGSLCRAYNTGITAMSDVVFNVSPVTLGGTEHAGKGSLLILPCIPCRLNILNTTTKVTASTTTTKTKWQTEGMKTHCDLRS